MNHIQKQAILCKAAKMRLAAAHVLRSRYNIKQAIFGPWIGHRPTYKYNPNHFNADRKRNWIGYFAGAWPEDYTYTALDSDYDSTGTRTISGFNRGLPLKDPRKKVDTNQKPLENVQKLRSSKKRMIPPPLVPPKAKTDKQQFLDNLNKKEIEESPIPTKPKPAENPTEPIEPVTTEDMPGIIRGLMGDKHKSVDPFDGFSL